MSEWSAVPLIDLAVDEKSAISKPYGSAILASDYRPSGVPVVRGINLADGGFRDADFVFIEPSLAARMPGAELIAGDLVVTHRGTVGQVSMIPRSPRYPTYACSTSQVKVRLDQNRAVPEFYFYWFQSPAGRQSLLEHSSTVGVPGIAQPVATIKKLRVPFPAPAIQRAVARILGALDDKIVANRQAGAMALQVIELQFLQARRSDTAWQTTFDASCSIGGGGTPRTADEALWGGQIKWATPTDVTRLEAPYLWSTTRTITEEGLAACSSRLYAARTILMTSRATIGAFALNMVPMAVNQGFIALRPNREELLWWFLADMMSRVDEFKSHANGATFLELSRGRFRNLAVNLTTESVMLEFCERAESLHSLCMSLDRENAKLAEQRDTLLPHLMSGRLAVKAAESIVSDAV